ncbi:5'-deoxynucleotidase HDDC2 isoform X2 [Perognathus longimembris pacificus]|uniref:5'-deoxynucleotidase HDDC2 isoform X2 n=1 Tax=Perognathus longimembris pacificus TaxID=214514 RepID=UPI002019F82A|nr:5'-deoxynucleotidase HDDC2 isoform X2 [Perognathus longimembris pacificus]
MASAPSGLGARPLLQFLRLVGQLKRVPRTGWVYRNVKNPESVSDHMYRMAIMAMVTKDNHLNKDRCMRLALVHDMAECIVGDIAPADNIPKEEKHRREEEAMKQITQLLPEDLRKELYELWEFLYSFILNFESVPRTFSSCGSLTWMVAPGGQTRLDCVRPELVHYRHGQDLSQDA